MKHIVLLRFWLGYVVPLLALGTCGVYAAALVDEDEVTTNRTNTTDTTDATTVRSMPHHHRVKSNRKRCRYSENEIDEWNSRNLRRQQQQQQQYYATRDSGSEVVFSSGGGGGGKHQPKTRDRDLASQLQTRFGDSNHQQSYSIEYHQRHHFTNNHHQQASAASEKEIVFVDIGDKVNLTCHIRAREIDWHFKDKNMTTTILSYGMQLQVIAPPPSSSSSSSQPNGLFPPNYDDYDISNQLFMTPQQERFVKYELNSDRHSTHVLTLHVQSAQDEGAYQCVDAKSDVPVKKTILVYLKNDSRALTSGYNANQIGSSLMFFYALTFLITVFNS